MIDGREFDAMSMLNLERLSSPAGWSGSLSHISMADIASIDWSSLLRDIEN